MEKRNMRFVPTRFTLPLFMLTRKSLKRDELHHVCKYLIKKSNLLAQQCKNENLKENETRTLHHLKHVVGMEERKVQGPCMAKPKQQTVRSDIVYRRKSTSPKRPKIKSKSVSGRQQVRKTKQKPPSAIDSTNKTRTFYNISLNSGVCNKYKGVMLSNARMRRPTQRMMIADLASCHREPYEPSPTTYYPKYTEEPFAVPKLYSPIPNPHIFYHKSVVPVKSNSIHKPHTSSMPGPGRYNPFYPTSCPCSRKLKPKLGLRIFIDQQKRAKFRRLAYVKIKITNYCDPEWDHVKGHGFQHLFKKPKSMLSTKRVDHKGRKRDDLVNINTINYKYLQLINYPQRKVFSFRLQPIPRREPQIKFSSLEKYIIRKQLRFNKKIAFGTGKDRFPDMPCPMPLSAIKLQKIKTQIPDDRRFTNKPVMQKPLSCIQTKYMEPVKRRYPMMDLSLRKRDFRFMPLPEAKLLMSSDEILISTKKSGFYHKHIAPEDYFNKAEIFEQNFMEITTRQTI